MTRSKFLPRVLAAAAGLLCAALPCEAFLGFGKPSRAGLLWVPSESFSDWERVASALKSHGKLSFTAALTPAMATPEARYALQPFVAEGRLEVAFRLDGDPVLPIVHDHPAAPRPQDALELLTAGLRKHRALWGNVPAGFVPAGGSVHPGLFPLFRSLGLAWVAVGAPGASAVPASAAAPGGRITPAPGERAWTFPLAACRPVRTPGRDLVPASLEELVREGGILVIDESAGSAAEGAWVRLLSDPGRAKGLLKRFERVSDAVAGASGTASADKASAARAPENWLGGEDAWTRTPEQKVAWRLYGDAARLVSEAGNSGADPKALAAAVADLRSAQAGKFYRVLGGSDREAMEEADRGLRKRLISVYRRLRRPEPDSILLSVLTSARSSRAFETKADSFTCRRGSDWLSCDNPAAPPGVRADNRIVQFRVQWDADSVVLVFRLGKVRSSTAAPSGFEGPELTAYIDFNHLAGAGSTRLLGEGAGASINPEDAWEAAVSVSGWGGSVHRASPSGDPVLEVRQRPEGDPAGAEVSLRVPRAKLRGNPAVWGYVVTASGPGDGALRNVLGDALLQKKILSGSRGLRLKAARAAQGL